MLRCKTQSLNTDRTAMIWFQVLLELFNIYTIPHSDQKVKSPNKDNCREEYVRKFSTDVRLMPKLKMILNTRRSINNTSVFIQQRKDTKRQTQA